jgi:two-component system NtrC family sensor kinase
MTDLSASLLIVDDDPAMLRALAESAAVRGYRVAAAATVAAALDLLARDAFDAALVDLALDGDSGFDLLPRIKAASPDCEIVVISGADALASPLRSYELAAFAFVPKPFDREFLFRTIDRARERARLNGHNRRLMWELQTINEIAQGIARSLELDDVLTGALQRLVRAMEGVGGSVRLRDSLTNEPVVRASVGPATLLRIWDDFEIAVPRPSEQVLASGRPVMIDDLAALVAPRCGAALPVRSLVCVPLTAGTDMLGTVAVASAHPRRFGPADQEFMSLVASQVVVAIENARLHDSVRRGKREWEQTFDAISDPIAVFDSRGELLRGNAALAAHLRLPITMLRQMSCREVGFCGGECETGWIGANGEASSSCAVARAVAHAGGRREITLQDGQIFSVTTFRVGSGREGASVVQVAKNVTEEIRSARRLRQMSEELALANTRLMATVDQLKSTQAQLLQSEKLSAIGQLVAGVAHELNNPLTSVIGYAQILEGELLDSNAEAGMRSAPQLAQDMRRIAEESERAARIVRNLLAFARRQTAARAPHDVTDLCTRVLALRAYELRLNGVELTTEFPPSLPRVVADGGQLQQALLNLVLNAEQAMRSRPVRKLMVGARHDEAAATVELFVSDSGHGIDTANLSRIFDPFFTTRDVGEGTGLGLSICYGIVRDHGGYIRVDSKVQVGTTFVIALPTCLEPPPAPDPILVAHSEQGDREFVIAALAGWGFKPIGASTVDQAIDCYRRGDLQAALVDRALIAVDVGAWRAARAADPRRVPLVLTSMTPEADRDREVGRFSREEASAVLAPPFELRALRSALRAVSKECV